jgi:CRP/FNR family transcriptional regulator, anaerobic regulatory protein
MITAPEDEIVKFITRFASPPAEQVRKFAAAARTSLIAKGSFLVELGDTAHPLYFIHSGAVRYTLIVPDSGEDVTKDFSFAPTFAASFGSAVSGQPARVAIAAMTDCVVSSWPLQRLTALYDADPQWQKLGRKLAEWLYVRKEDREIAFLTQTAEQRYAALTLTFPGMIDQLPQRHLASYLGITPESLSRLKARLAKRG